MAEIIGLAASAAGGGVFGLVGTALGRVAGIFERKQYYTHEKARWAHEASLAALAHKAEAETAKRQRALEEVAGQWSGLQASITADASIGSSYLWVNAVRGLTRPCLTLLLWLITVLVYLNSEADGQARIVETATFAATAATLWWFGDRGPKQR